MIGINFLETRASNTIRVGIDNAQVRQQCTEIIREYNDCVSRTIKDLGKTDAVSLSIRCATEAPIVYRLHRLAETEKQTLKGIIRELLDNIIIRESTSPYASPN